MKKKQYVYIIIIGAFILFFLNVSLLHMEYKNYHDKMEILYLMLSNNNIDEDNLELITSLLKESNSEILLAAKEQLRQYGYITSYTDVYKKDMYKQWIMIICMSCIIYIFFLFSLFFISNKFKKRRNNEFDELTKYIIGFREGNYDLFPFIQTNPLSCDTFLQRLQMNLESLASQIKIMKQQASADKEKTKSLVTDISHQLRSPLAALKTSFDILEKQDLSYEEKEEFEGRCREQINRLEELVIALVNISRMETGMIEIQSKNEYIFNTIISAINRIYPYAEEKHIGISLEALDELQELKIPHDNKWLAEAIINVLENAVKYSPNNTSIIIRMIKMTIFLRIEVEDKGIGIKQQDRNKIFKRFYRGESEIIRQKAGSGVGLYLTRKIIERHNGTISVTSPHKDIAVSQGSIFIIQIPLKRYNSYLHVF